MQQLSTITFSFCISKDNQVTGDGKINQETPCIRCYELSSSLQITSKLFGVNMGIYYR